MTKSTIQIIYQTGAGEERRAVEVIARYGPLVVHRSQGPTPGKGEAKGWSITHIPSLLRVHTQPIGSQQRAKKLARHLSVHCHWCMVNTSGQASSDFLRELRAELSAYNVV